MKQAKIILEKDCIKVLLRADGRQQYGVNSILTRKNAYILKWLFNKIAELRYLGYSVEFEDKDNSPIPENAY